MSMEGSAQRRLLGAALVVLLSSCANDASEPESIVNFTTTQVSGVLVGLCTVAVNWELTAQIEAP